VVGTSEVVATGSIKVLEEPCSSVVELEGEIDVALRTEAGAALASALERDLPVVLDTSKVTFVDSTGIAFLVQFATIGHDEGLHVTLRNPPTVVVEVLDLLGVSDLFVDAA
jgi:anti-anti-sigma factor